jgi:transposase
VIGPLLGVPLPGGRGRPVIWPRRVIADAILYVVRTGCAWRYLPSEYPPWRTVHGYFARWQADGTLDRVHDELRAQVRAAAGRHRPPSAAVIDSQAVRGAGTVPRASRGWDNAKKVNGRKRHIAAGTSCCWRPWSPRASTLDRHGARPLLWRLRTGSRHVQLVWGAAGYTGTPITWAQTSLHLATTIVAKPGPRTFQVLPRRWVVERTFAWISKHRRCTRDYERLPEHHHAMITWAMIALMTRRLARTPAQPAHAALAAA